MSPALDVASGVAPVQPEQRQHARRARIFPPQPPYRELCRALPVRSVWLFTLDNAFRRSCIFMVKSKLFERLTLIVILVTCVLLAMDSNEPGFARTRRARGLRGAEWFFVIVFTVEMLLKVVALGFWEAPGSYLRDPWNVPDFIVVVMSWVSLSPSVENVSAMRCVRILRPLRTITGIEGMRMLVGTLLSSLPMLLDVLILCAFLFFILGTVGVQTFAGALRTNCGTPEPGTWRGDIMANVTRFEPVAGEDDPYRSCGDGIIKLPETGGWFAPNGALPADGESA